MEALAFIIFPAASHVPSKSETSQRTLQDKGISVIPAASASDWIHFRCAGSRLSADSLAATINYVKIETYQIFGICFCLHLMINFLTIGYEWKLCPSEVSYRLE